MKNRYKTSTGESYTDGTIKNKLSKEMKGWMANYLCEGLGHPHVAHDWDHTIPKARCKILHKTELIWTRGNVVRSCRTAHMEWESYKDGKFSHHKNAYKRMLFVAIHDHETFIKRYYCITNDKLKEKLTPLFEEITSESSI